MIFWQGYGIAALAIPFCIGLIIQIASNNISGQPDYYNQAWWPILLTCVISAVLVYLTGNYFEKQPAKILIDKETGKEFKLEKKHTFFFIPIKYWSLAWLGVGIYLTVKRFIH